MFEILRREATALVKQCGLGGLPHEQLPKGFPGLKEAVRCGGSPRCSNCRQVALGIAHQIDVLMGDAY